MHLGFGYWVVRERETGRFVGEVGFANFHRDLEPPIGDDPEAGWGLAPRAHGRGYATEAMTAAHAWLERNMGTTRTVCTIRAHNRASLRMAEKQGYRELRTQDPERPLIVLERQI